MFKQLAARVFSRSHRFYANDLQKVADIAIDKAAMVLRKNAVVPRLVSRDLQNTAAKKNEMITVPVYPAMSPIAVTPGRGNENTPIDITPTDVEIRLREFYEVPFTMSEVEMAEVEENRVLPDVLEQAVIGLADHVNAFILNKLKNRSFNFVAATTPAAIADIINMRKALNKESVMKNMRSACYSDDIEAELLNLAVFHAADQAGQARTQEEGDLGRKLGFDNYAQSAMPSHTAGDAASYVIDNAGGYPVGTTTLHLDGGTGDHLEGDIVTIGGLPYVITATSLGDGDKDITIHPGLRAAVADNAAVADPIATHNVGGLGFHKGAFAFAARPLAAAGHPGVIQSQTTDPVSGLSMRITAQYVNKSLEWSVDILYGGEVIRPEAITRLTD